MAYPCGLQVASGYVQLSVGESELTISHMAGPVCTGATSALVAQVGTPAGPHPARTSGISIAAARRVLHFDLIFEFIYPLLSL
jgi:hypothetical protein